MTKIKEVLLDLNPWWKKDFTIEFNERAVYAKIKKYMALPQMIALTGLRRVGKTTLMLKMVEDYLKSGFEAMDILFFSFDEFRETSIKEMIKAYEETLERDIGEGKHVILLDEIQKLEDWESQLKTIYDAFKGKVKIIISGSESLFIKKKSKGSLAGRIFEFKIETLSFKEFLVFKNAKYRPIGLHERDLKRLFKEFILIQGFPELVGIDDREIIKKYIIESIAEKVLYKDIPGLFKVRDIGLMESLLKIIMEEPGQIIGAITLSKELNSSRQTIAAYLSYLEESFIVRKLYNYSRSRRKVERKLKKFYPAIVSVDLLFKEDALSKSKVFEWMIVSQLKAEFFWRDNYKNEVDIVIPKEKPLPIEVKFGKIDLKGMKAFLKKFKSNEGIIITNDIEEKREIGSKTISMIPAYKFLLKYE